MSATAERLLPDPAMATIRALAERVRQRHGLAAGATLPRIRDQIRGEGPDFADAVLVAACGDDDWVRFVDELLVHETYFYRHPAQLDALAAWLRSRRRQVGATRIWCAACATGEEAWTVALIAADAAILATDLSAAALAVARAGRYERRVGLDSFRAIPAAARPHFADALAAGPGAAWTVPARLRPLVRFMRHDLMTPPPIEDADIVLCRNAMIYLEPAAAAAVERRLAQALRPGGLLLTGPAEMPRDRTLFVADGDPAAMIWRRRSAA